MSKTDRNPKTEPAERDMPMPPAAGALMERHEPESVRLVAIPRISIARHYRTTALDGTRLTIPVYVTTKRAEQVTHPHYFESLTRFGSGVCQACGATGWSAFWVVEGWQGEATGAWIAAEQARMDDLTAMSIVADTLGGVVIDVEAADAQLDALDEEEPIVFGPLAKWGPKPADDGMLRLLSAVLDLDEPARQRRTGLPVPKMERGHLTIVD